MLVLFALTSNADFHFHRIVELHGTGEDILSILDVQCPFLYAETFKTLW